jgi:competence protein ComEA
VPLLRRPSPPDPLVEERMGRLLVRPDVPGGWVPPPHDEPTSERDVEQVQTVGPERSWAPRPADAPARRAGLLPSTLAGGRLDPGHRGAVALLLVCLLASVVTAGVVLRGRPQEVAVPHLEQAGTVLPGAPETAPSASPAPTELVVAVVGDVALPGLVRLPPGSRVDDAVRAAGGLRPGGSAGLLNLARQLVDGEQLVVGPDAPPDPAPGAGGGAATAGGLLDLNRASASELEGLPGIGPVLAERIMEWRTEHGGFASIDQLREVPGIGEAKYSSIKAKVAV